MKDAGAPSRPLLQRAFARSWTNIAGTFAVIGRRFRRRPAQYDRIFWLSWTLGCSLLAGLAAIFLDRASVCDWPPAFKAVAEMSTPLGLGEWYLWPAAAWILLANQIDWSRLGRKQLVAVYNRTSISLFVLAAVGLPGLLTILMKILIGRARPALYDDYGAFSSHPFTVKAIFASFPSGHATTIGSVSAILVLLFPRGKYVFLLLGLWFASTRIFVGAHYPSDTIVGFGLGFGLAVVTAIVCARLGFLFRSNPIGLPRLKRTVWRTPKAERTLTFYAAHNQPAAQHQSVSLGNMDTL